MSNIYVQKGYKSREDYLKQLSEDNNIALGVIFDFAECNGPGEDFDGLPAMIEEYLESFNDEDYNDMEDSDE